MEKDSVSRVFFHKHKEGVRHIAGKTIDYIRVSTIEQKNNEKRRKTT